MTTEERLTNEEQAELRRLCYEGRQVISWIRQGNTHINNGFAFTRLFERFITLTEKAAGFTDPLRHGEFHLSEGE